jgi:tRNA(Ile)-lysidine synthetase-like protein
MAGIASTLLSPLYDLPEPLLVGVSGGVDSVALLYALLEIGRRPVVLHFDHGWRAQSRADGAWVKKLAQAQGLKFVGGKKSGLRPREAEARAARYAFFTATARRLGIADLALAHQADDQVETFLLQLFRGSGSGGRGMDPVSQRDGLVLHRPWLGVWRKEILGYARRRRLAWREDETNLDPVHRRNFIRHRLLPYLRRRVSPRVAENLWRAAEIARAEGEWMDFLCGHPAEELSVKNLRADPPGRQRRIIRRWLQTRGVGDIGFAEVEAVRGLVAKAIPAKVNLSAGRFARRRAGKIFVE